jgi:hypothetical protein
VPRELSCSQGVSIYSLPTQTSRLEELVGFLRQLQTVRQLQADSPPAPPTVNCCKNGVVRTSCYSLIGQSAIQDRIVRLDKTFCLRCWRQTGLSDVRNRTVRGAGLSGQTNRTVRFRRQVKETSLCVYLFSHVPCFSRYAMQRLNHKALSKFPSKRTSAPLNRTAI